MKRLRMLTVATLAGILALNLSLPSPAAVSPDRLKPVDLILIEGYKREPHPKIEAHRAETGKPLLSPDNASIRAVAADSAIETALPRFDLDDTRAIADFILREVGL